MDNLRSTQSRRTGRGVFMGRESAYVAMVA